MCHCHIARLYVIFDTLQKLLLLVSQYARQLLGRPTVNLSCDILCFCFANLRKVTFRGKLRLDRQDISGYIWRYRETDNVTPQFKWYTPSEKDKTSHSSYRMQGRAASIWIDPVHGKKRKRFAQSIDDMLPTCRLLPVLTTIQNFRSKSLDCPQKNHATRSWV